MHPTFTIYVNQQVKAILKLRCRKKRMALTHNTSIPLFSHMAESNEGRSMAAPLSDCTIEKQRAVVCFLWEIHCQMLAQYGACTMHQ
jgi:hypothetical protein